MSSDNESVDAFPLSRRAGWSVSTALLTGLIAIFSLVVSIWSAVEAHRATTLQAESAFQERQVALVESCAEATPSLFQVGDDFVDLQSVSVDSEFWNSSDRPFFYESRPKQQRVVVRCQFTNWQLYTCRKMPPT